MNQTQAPRIGQILCLDRRNHRLAVPVSRESLRSRDRYKTFGVRTLRATLPERTRRFDSEAQGAHWTQVVIQFNNKEE